MCTPVESIKEILSLMTTLACTLKHLQGVDVQLQIKFPCTWVIRKLCFVESSARASELLIAFIANLNLAEQVIALGKRAVATRTSHKVAFCHMQVVELLNELIEELDLVEDAVIAKATEHIHANEVILTFGLSHTVLKFLLKAAERRTFQARTALHRSSP